MRNATIKIAQTTQPYIGLAKIDWTNPLTRGLRHCYLPGQSKRNIVNDRHTLSTGSELKTRITTQGPGFTNATGEVDGLISLTIPKYFEDLQAPLTFASVFMITNSSPSVGGPFIGIRKPTTGFHTGDPGLWIEQQAFGQIIAFSWRHEDFSGTADVSITTECPLNEVHSVVGVSISPTDHRVYGSWDPAEYTTVGDLGGPTQTQEVLGLGNWTGSQIDPFGYLIGSSLLILIWARPLAFAEAKSLNLNPWQVFESEVQHIFMHVRANILYRRRHIGFHYG